MSTSQNKQIVLQWIDAAAIADEQAILDLLTEDFVFKSMARRPKWLAYRWNRQEFAHAPTAEGSLLKDGKSMKLEVLGLLAEDNKVVLETKSDTELKNGKKYANAYTFVFDFRDGKICEIREYSCTHLQVETWGEFDPNNPQASLAAQGADA